MRDFTAVVACETRFLFVGGLGDEGRRAELLRLCLVCRWNAFASGLFLHQSIFNHAPSRRANADKAALRAGKLE